MCKALTAFKKLARKTQIGYAHTQKERERDTLPLTFCILQETEKKILSIIYDTHATMFEGAENMLF